MAASEEQKLPNPWVGYDHRGHSVVDDVTAVPQIFSGNHCNVRVTVGAWDSNGSTQPESTAPLWIPKGYEHPAKPLVQPLHRVQIDRPAESLPVETETAWAEDHLTGHSHRPFDPKDQEEQPDTQVGAITHAHTTEHPG